MVFRRVDLLATGDKIAIGQPGARHLVTITSTQDMGRQLSRRVIKVSFDNNTAANWYDCDMVEIAHA